MSVCVLDQPNDPHNRAFHFPAMKTVNPITEFGTCLNTTTTTAFPDMINEKQWDTTPMEIDSDEPIQSNFSFWVLPPELRTMVYRELLLSDSAFRLGHHGPYSHEKRRQLHPQILRTCRWIFMEASEVLYGDNTFYLGPIGHKPTYSASFTTSIGVHNAAKLRTLVAHCTHTTSLNERYLRNWIISFGLGVDRLKVLAISFSPCVTGESASSTSMAVATIQPTHQQHNRQNHNHPPHHPHHHHHHHHPHHNHNHTPHHHHIRASQNQPQSTFAPFITTTTQTTFNLQHPTATPTPHSTFTPFLGPPIGNFNILTNVTNHNHNNSGGHPLPPATAVVGSSPVSTPATERQEAEKTQLDFALMESRMQNWLVRAEPAQVRQWIQIKNTDLRAGERWLLYVCPSLQAMRSLRF